MKSEEWLLNELNLVIKDYQNYIDYINYDKNDYERILSIQTREKLVEFWITIIRLAEILDLVTYTYQTNKEEFATKIIEMIKKNKGGLNENEKKI